MPTRIAIVEDHPVVRQGLRAWLAESEFQLVGEAGSAETAVAMVRGCHPDLLLLDVRLPGADGLDCLTRLRDEGLRMPAVIFSGYDNPTFSARASAIGALGYLSKEIDQETLLAALRTAARGESCWSREEMRRLTGALATDRVENDLEAPLTKRENEVLKQLAFGLSNKEIAQALGISYETAKEHVQHILRKIGVTDRTQAAVWAVRRGLV
jgi:DNA-binding NarL/FixJ family response regulator